MFLADYLVGVLFLIFFPGVSIALRLLSTSTVSIAIMAATTQVFHSRQNTTTIVLAANVVMEIKPENTIM